MDYYNREKIHNFCETMFPKKNPYLKDIYEKEPENHMYTIINEICARQVEAQDQLIMQTIQNIGGHLHTDITIDKNKVLEALEMYKTMQWVPVKDRLPERSGFYLVSIGGAEWGSIGMCRWNAVDKKWHGAQIGSVIEGVYCWMPLPKTPEGESMYE